MPVVPEDRPIAAVREETIDQLIVNYGHGELSLAAFERRLDQALDARSAEQLSVLTADLDLAVDPEYAERKKAELGLRSNRELVEADRADFMVHIFGSSKRSGAWAVAKNVWMFSLFGGSELDFTDARFSSRETNVNVLCLFSGANLFVPENVDTVSKAICIFGGVDNRASSAAARHAPKLVIKGVILFGGVRVSVKKTLRDRWLEFASSVREMFSPPGSRL